MNRYEFAAIVCVLMCGVGATQLTAVNGQTPPSTLKAPDGWRSVGTSLVAAAPSSQPTTHWITIWAPDVPASQPSNGGTLPPPASQPASDLETAVGNLRDDVAALQKKLDALTAPKPKQEFDALLKAAFEAWGPPNMIHPTKGGFVNVPDGFHGIDPGVFAGYEGVHLNGGGGWTSHLYSTDPKATVLDFTGARHCRVTGLRIDGKQGAAIVCGRIANPVDPTEGPGSYGQHLFTDVTTEEGCYIIASESNDWVACNFQTSTAKPAMFIGNEHADYPQAVWSGMQSQHFYGCDWRSSYTGTDGRILVGSNTPKYFKDADGEFRWHPTVFNDIYIYGGEFGAAACCTDGPGIEFILAAQNYNIVIEGMRGELRGCDFGFLFTVPAGTWDNSASGVGTVVIRDSSFFPGHDLLRVRGGGLLNHAILTNLYVSSESTLPWTGPVGPNGERPYVSGNLQNCVVELINAIKDPNDHTQGSTDVISGGP